MLILTIVATGMAIGGLAQLLLGRTSTRVDWTIALVTGIAGSFLGGAAASVIAGDGLALRPSGLIGTFIGATVFTAAWFYRDRSRTQEV